MKVLIMSFFFIMPALFSEEESNAKKISILVDESYRNRGSQTQEERNAEIKRLTEEQFIIQTKNY